MTSASAEAVSAPAEDPVAELASIFHMSHADASAAVKRYAFETKLTQKAAAAAALSEALEQRQAMDDYRLELSQELGDEVPASGGGGQFILKASRQVGDVFFDPTGAYGFGHIGLFSYTWQVAEAPGNGKNTRTSLAQYRRVAKGTTKENVRTSAARSRRAGNWARAHLGRSYNNVFFDNNDVESSKYNCSQFVWAAYKANGMDLNSNGGSGVYPKDISGDPRVNYYYKFGS